MNNSMPIFPSTKSFSFSKIINGISNVLDVTNKALPIYKEIKPIVSRGKSLLNIFKNDSSNNIELEIKNNNLNKPQFYH